MTGNSHSIGHPARDQRRCESCNEPLLSHVLSCPSPRVYSQEKAAGHLLHVNPAWERATQAVARQDVGSFLTRRGGGASRSWSVTGSSGSVCRRLRLARSGSTSGRGTSARGMATGRTLGSLKSSTEVDDIIGQAAATPAEEQR